MSIERGRMIAAGAEALDLAVERILEASPEIPLVDLVRQVSAQGESALADFDPADARSALYTFIAMRLLREREVVIFPRGDRVPAPPPSHRRLAE